MLGPNLELDTYYDATEPSPDLQNQRRTMSVATEYISMKEHCLVLSSLETVQIQELF